MFCLPVTWAQRTVRPLAAAHSLSSGSPSEELPDGCHDTVGDRANSFRYSSESFVAPCPIAVARVASSISCASILVMFFCYDSP